LVCLIGADVCVFCIVKYLLQHNIFVQSISTGIFFTQSLPK
jgi:hypothetical protein